MKITYYGHSCLLVEGGGKRVIVDPFLSGNPNSGISPNDVQVDAVILSHGHEDHLGDAVEIAAANQAPIIATFELAMICKKRGAAVHAMNTGGAYSFDGFKVKLTQAFHSSSVLEGDQYLYAGQPAGIILIMNKQALYHAGDTALFSDMKLIGQTQAIDVAALPIGDNYTMGPDEALIAAQWVGAKRVIPIHYNTFPAIAQDAQAFCSRLKSLDIEGYPLKSGESLKI